MSDQLNEIKLHIKLEDSVALRKEDSMLKKSFTRLNKRSSSRRRSQRTKYLKIGAVSLILTLSVGATFGLWSNIRAAWRPRAAVASPLVQPPPAIPSANNPSKEYIYAGGKLIATEEPANNVAPTVNITAPVSNFAFAADSNLQITANASDADGSVSQVQIFQGATPLGLATAAGGGVYNFTWNNVAAGTYTLTAQATDNSGTVATSTAVTVKSNVAPALSVTSPANNATFTAPATIPISASANDSDGGVSQVQFYQGSTLIGTATTSPYSVTWTNVAAGTYSLTAKATDNNGATGTSGSVNVTVTTPANQPPTVSITSPPNGSVVSAPATITINASANDSDGTVTKVDFYQGATLIGTDTTSPYSVTWSNVAAGSYTLTAKATDNSGSVSTSGPVSVTVNSAPNVPPTLSITGPPNNTVSTAPATFTIDANASDSDGSVSKVEFYQGATLIGTDTSSPYSFTWTNVAAGTYSVTAKATDNSGAVATSSAVTVISNAPPTVSISGPPNNTVASAPASFTINANVNDPDGSISKVDFYQGSTLIGTDTTSPYSFTWSNVAPGSYSVTAKATDNNGAVTTSSAVTVISNAPPTVSISSPPNNTVATAPASFTINATVNDSDGTISKVDFYQGSTLIGTDTTFPYSFTWSNVAAGTYAVTVKATDNNGAVGTSAPINVISNALPSVNITNPANNTVVPASTNVTIDANASDSDGTISKVEFYQGSTLIATDTTVPYSVTWPNVAAGTYSLTARATDNCGAVATSGAVTVIANGAPTVSITSPANNAMFTPPASITINATASDSDGTISKVEFYQGSTLIGTDTSSPFSVTWANVASGSYVLTAKATDNSGVTTTSAAVAVTTPSFFDDFNDNSLSALNWTVTSPGSPAVVSEQGQQLRVTLQPSTAGYNGIQSNASYDMRGGTVQVELVQPVNQGGWVENSMTVQLDPQNYFLFNVGAGSIMYRSRVNGSDDQLVTPFDPVAHRFWRVRHDQILNLVNFETSPEGATWTIRKTVNPGFSLVGMKVVLAAGAWGTGNGSPGAAIYNDIQYIASALPPPAFSDDFNDNSLDSTKWTETIPGSPAVVSEQGQQLRITLQPNTAGYNGIQSNSSYDMRGGTVQVEVPQTVSQAGWVENSMSVQLDAQNYYLFNVGAGSIMFRSMVNGADDQLVTSFNPVSDRFWRIRHDQATNLVSFETSADGVTWNTRKTVTPGFSLVGVRFVLSAGAWGTGNSAPGAAIYDDFRYIGIAPSSPPILGDDFNDNSIDTAKWNTDNLFSGFTSLSVPISETTQRLEIGPLLQNTSGSNYRGVRSVNSYNFTGSYAYVELVQAAVSTTAADSMFTIGKDSDNYYRIYVNGGMLIGLRKIAGGKTTLFSIPYDANQHRFLRITNTAGNVTLDTAASAGGVPAAWVQRYSESWNSAVPTNSVLLELKGGTSVAETNGPPGKVIFDNFRMALNGS